MTIRRQNPPGESFLASRPAPRVIRPGDAGHDAGDAAAPWTNDVRPAPPLSSTAPPVRTVTAPTRPTPPLTLAALATRLGEMVWLEQRLFEVLGFWSSIEPNAALSVAFAEASRHHGWHASLWEEHLPDAHGLKDVGQIKAPNAGWVALFEELVRTAEPDRSADRVAAILRVVEPWLRIRDEQISGGLAPLSDRALMRAQRFVAMDHEQDNERMRDIAPDLPPGRGQAFIDQLFSLISERAPRE